jgi:UDP-N-acetylmuramyl pentapeptide phosphotransferase/UDP-N-acetylglucosamine-1-phosphate transferase
MTGSFWVTAAVPVAVFALTLWLCGRLRLWLARRAILDQPVQRSSHSVPVPRGGGLAVVPVVVAAWLLLALLAAAPPPAAGIAGLALALALLSWRDDVSGLPAALRLAAHAAAVAVGLALLPEGRVFQGLLPPVLDSAAAALLWLWFINLFNFMDGIDGITGIETVTLGLGIAATALLTGLPDGSTALALCLSAGALAFLRWNWHPARLFLGDSGSVPLGFLLGWLLLALAARGLWAPALILPLYYLADASLTLAFRLARGERIWQAHRQHFYQRALGPDRDHAKVARLVLAGDAALLLLALAATSWPAPALAGAVLTVAAMLALLERRARAGVADPSP